MKRSKIVLGMTTGILAVAALMAAKASRFSVIRHSYYSLNFGTCTYASTNQYFTANSGDGNEAVDAQGHWLYSFNATSCQPNRRLFTKKKD